MKTVSFKGLSAFAALAMLLVACGGAAPSPTAAPATAAPAPTEAPKATDVPAPTAAPKATTAPAPTEAPKATTAPAMVKGSPGQEYDDALTGKYKGTKVTVFGPFTGQDEVKFNNTIKDFADKTGIQIVYEGSKEFESAINIKAEANNAPDIADFPQPGLMARIASAGKIQDASKMVNADWLKANYNQSLVDSLMVTGKDGKILGGVWERINGKSLVWYPKKAWDAAGYKIPQTWDEMLALSDKIVKDGDTPWCIGIESGTATGWAATDWMEDIMLRTTSLENYDKWTTGELKFTDPIVKNAAKVMQNIWFNDKYVYGGTKSIASTNFGDAPKPMFDKSGPKCWLHKQGNFITSFFPADAKPGVDYDFFYLPPIDPQYGKPFEFAGDLMAAFNDRPEVRAVMQFFTKGEHLKGWMASGGAIAPQKDADPAWYGSDIERKVDSFVKGATSLRFDGSDLMPGQVGAGTFWKAMADWVSGTADLDKAMDEAQAGWANVK